MTSTSIPTENTELLRWVEHWTAILQPDAVHWCDGSEAEYGELCRRLVESGTFGPSAAASPPDDGGGHASPARAIDGDQQL